ncbi:MAG: hydantoinase B/oxoprolinase family protein [Rhodovibrionaceae bacterium]
MSVDAITLEIIANRFNEIQRIMKHRLFRTGYSTILRESFDGGAGLTDSDGNVIGASGMSIHTRPYACFVAGILKAYGKQGIDEGDVFISNDPYKGGVAHSPDMAVATPVFVGGDLIAFCTSIAHKADIGGLAPGSASPDSRSIFHEGLLVPPCKFYQAGKMVDSVRMILENNSRTPRLLIGDLMGQVGCTRVGAQLITELCEQEGIGTILSAIEQLMDSSEQRLREALKRIPDGEATAENFLDGDGIVERPVRVALRAVKKGDSITLDFTGSDKQTAGPASAVVQALEAAAIAALLSVADYTITNNEGVRRVIDFVFPEGTVVNPTHPTPVNSYIPISHLVYNSVMEVMGKLVPDRAAADSGLGLGGLAIGYNATRAGGSYVHYEIMVTGTGGTSRVDGCSAIMPMLNFESVQPIEIVESEFPVRITEFSMLKDSCGAGYHRGGVGIKREYELLSDAQVVSRLSQRRHGSKGLAGGKAPPVSRTVLLEDGEQRELPGLIRFAAKAGTRICLEQSGGGGWGDPLERDPAAVLTDVGDGFVSVESARKDYGVIVEQDKAGRYVIARLDRPQGGVQIASE